MMHTTSPSEWLQWVSLSAAVYAAGAGLVLLLAPAEEWAWPHPVAAVVGRLRAAEESGAFDPLLIAVAGALYDAREFAAEARQFACLSLRDAALTVAALPLLLASPASKEATR